MTEIDHTPAGTVPPNPLIHDNPAETLSDCVRVLNVLRAVRPEEIPDDGEGYGLFLAMGIVGEALSFEAQRVTVRDPA